ncbi:unnamed protein product, partial [Ectocarpus sp. 8 AP-2014]
ADHIITSHGRREATLQSMSNERQHAWSILLEGNSTRSTVLRQPAGFILRRRAWHMRG